MNFSWKKYAGQFIKQSRIEFISAIYPAML